MTTSEKLEPDRDGDIANRLVARVVAAPVVDLAVWTLVDIHQRDEPTSGWYDATDDGAPFTGMRSRRPPER